MMYFGAAIDVAHIEANRGYADKGSASYFGTVKVNAQFILKSICMNLKKAVAPNTPDGLLHPISVRNIPRSLPLSDSSQSIDQSASENSLCGCDGLHHIPINSYPAHQWYCFKT
jgi:hypothetical protein